MVGNIRFFLYSFLLFFFNVYYAEITLSIESKNAYEAVLGESCTLELNMKNIPKGYKDPIIKSSEGITLERNGLYMSSINGNSQTKFTYSIHVDEIGTYTIGPAEIEQGGKKYTSNTVILHVTHEKINNNNEKKDIFMELTSEDYAVIGQKIDCTLTCYVKKSGITIERITPPNIKNIELNNLEGPIKDEVKIDGNLYTTLSWHWNIIPDKEGDLIIPAATLEYSESKQAGFFFSMFSKTKRVFSNAHMLHVSNLPPHKGICHGIGNFSDFAAFLQPPLVKVGDAATITLRIKGNGTLYSKEHYMLQGLASHIRFYPINSKQKEDEYIFEYIIQPMQEGIFIIPRQEFTYFNITTKTYETLKTSPLELHITANPLLQNAQENQNNKEQIVAETNGSNIITSEENNEQNFVEESEFMAIKKKDYALDFLYFFILFVCLIIPYCIQYMRQNNARIAFVYNKMFFYCVVLYAELYLYFFRQHIQITTLHELFLTLIARRFSCHHEIVYLHYETLSKIIEQKIGSSLMWNQFLERIAEKKYGCGEAQKKDIQELYKEARIWLRIFRSL